MSGKDAMTVESLVTQFDRIERTILALYYCEDLTPAEIGHVLDKPERDIIDALADIRQRTATAIGVSTVESVSA